MEKKAFLFSNKKRHKGGTGVKCVFLMSMSTNTKMHLYHETEMVDEVNLDRVSWVLDKLEVEDKSN